MKSIINWIRFSKTRIIVIVLLIIALIVGLVKGCRNNIPTVGDNIQITKDTIIQREISYIPVSDTIKIASPEPIYIDTSYILEEKYRFKYINDSTKLKAHWDELVRKFASERKYEGERHLKDSLGKIKYTLNVRENELKDLEFIPEINHKVITVTNTIKETRTIKEQPRRKVYFGGGIGIKPTLPNTRVETLEMGFLYKNKKEVIIGLDGGYLPGNKSSYVEAKVYLPLSFRK